MRSSSPESASSNASERALRAPGRLSVKVAIPSASERRSGEASTAAWMVTGGSLRRNSSRGQCRAVGADAQVALAAFPRLAVEAKVAWPGRSRPATGRGGEDAGGLAWRAAVHPRASVHGRAGHLGRAAQHRAPLPFDARRGYARAEQAGRRLRSQGELARPGPRGPRGDPDAVPGGVLTGVP